MTEEHDRQLAQEEHLREEGEGPVRQRDRGHRGYSSFAAGPGASALFAAAVAATCAATWLDLSGGARAAGGAAWLAFVAAAAYRILRTGRIGRWRAALFVTLAWAFTLEFKAASLGLRGPAFAAPEVREVPYCHIALASSLLNTAYQQYLAARSGAFGEWAPLTAGALWLLFALAAGPAWCSWGCFYGGLDEGFARLAKRPLARFDRLPAPWRDLPAGILLACVLLSLASFLPVFCLWACPLKLTTGFLDPDAAVRRVQLGLFVAAAAVTLVAGPLATKKRLFCGLVCPFSAWQALWGRLHPFGVSVSADRCTRCGLCVRACPTIAFEEDASRLPTPSAYCNRCGECLDACPSGALSLTAYGRELPGAGRLAGLWRARTLFLYAALVLAGAVGSLFVPAALARLSPW